MKKLLTIAIALMTGIAVAAPDEKKKPEGEKGGAKGKGDKGAFFAKLAGDDGKISEEEWGNSPMAKKAKEAGKGDMIAARFKKIDADSSGDISKEEFIKGMMRGKGKGGDKGGKGKPEGKKPEGKKPEGKKDA